MANKPIVKFKTYKQALRVGGKIYGVPNLADPVPAGVTMQEVIDYAKLHNYSAATLEALLSQVIQSVADLVQRDGRPRNLSDLLKFEPVLKGTFANIESGVTSQQLIIRPRLLKVLRVKANNDIFSWQNENDSTAPKINSLAFEHDDAPIDSAATFNAAIADGGYPSFALSIAGQRLCPDGWPTDGTYDFNIRILRGDDVFNFKMIGDTSGSTPASYGFWWHDTNDYASDNAIIFSQRNDAPDAPCWKGTEEAPVPVAEFAAQPGDILEVEFSRPLSSDGSLAVATKRYTLGA